MIFDALGDRRDLWRVYYHDIPHLWLTGDAWVKRSARSNVELAFRAMSGMTNCRSTFIEPPRDPAVEQPASVHGREPWRAAHRARGPTSSSRIRACSKTLLLIVLTSTAVYDHVVPPGIPARARGSSRDRPVRPVRGGFEFDRLGRGSRPSSSHRGSSHSQTMGSHVDPLDGGVDDRLRGAFPAGSSCVHARVHAGRATPRRDASRLTYRSGDYLNSHHAIPTDIGGVAGGSGALAIALR